MKYFDVLFVVPGGHKKVFQQLADDFSAVEPPVLAGLFANYLRMKGCSVKIIDAPAEDLTPTEVVNLTIFYDPKLIVMMVYGHQPSASTQTMPAAGELCRLIKKQRKDAKIMMVGTHPSALPERTLKEEEVDFVCQGEGPITIYETLLALKSGGNDFSRVSGLWYWDGEK